MPGIKRSRSVDHIEPDVTPIDPPERSTIINSIETLCAFFDEFNIPTDPDIKKLYRRVLAKWDVIKNTKHNLKRKELHEFKINFYKIQIAYSIVRKFEEIEDYPSSEGFPTIRWSYPSKDLAKKICLVYAYCLSLVERRSADNTYQILNYLTIERPFRSLVNISSTLDGMCAAYNMMLKDAQTAAQKTQEFIEKREFDNAKRHLEVFKEAVDAASEQARLVDNFRLKTIRRCRTAIILTEFITDGSLLQSAGKAGRPTTKPQKIANEVNRVIEAVEVIKAATTGIKEQLAEINKQILETELFAAPISSSSSDRASVKEVDHRPLSYVVRAAQVGLAPSLDDLPDLTIYKKSMVLS
jgi:hypothetical protein